MADFYKGLAGGFETGLKLGEQLRKRRMEEELTAAEQRVPGVTEGAYGPQLQSNIEQVRGLQQEAINRQIAQGVDPIQATAQVGEQYAPAIAELQRRQGLTQADYSVGSQGPNYRYQDMALAQQGLQRAQLEADVYRQYGDRENAQKVMDAARAGLYRAEQAGFARAGEERAQSAEQRAQQLFTPQLAAAQSQADLGAINLELAQAAKNYRNWGSTPEGMAATGAGRVAKMREFGMSTEAIRTEEQAQRSEQEFQLRSQRIRQQLKTGKLNYQTAQIELDKERAKVQFDTALRDAFASGQPTDIETVQRIAQTIPNLPMSHMDTVAANMLGMKEAKFKEYKLDVANKIKGKDLDGMLSLHKSDPSFADGLHYTKAVDPKTGAVTLTEVDDATGKPTGKTLKFNSEARAVAELTQMATDPANLYTWRLQADEAEAKLRTATTRKMTKAQEIALQAFYKDENREFSRMSQGERDKWLAERGLTPFVNVGGLGGGLVDRPKTTSGKTKPETATKTQTGLDVSGTGKTVAEQMTATAASRSAAEAAKKRKAELEQQAAIERAAEQRYAQMNALAGLTPEIVASGTSAEAMRIMNSPVFDELPAAVKAAVTRKLYAPNYPVGLGNPAR